MVIIYGPGIAGCCSDARFTGQSAGELAPIEDRQRGNMMA